MKNRIRRITVLSLAVLLMGVWCVLPAAAAPAGLPSNAKTADLYYGGREVLDGRTYIIDGITYVPLSAFFRLMGSYRITWNEKTDTASVSGEGLYLYATEGRAYIYANGHYFYTEGSIRTIGGYLHVPIKPLAKALNLTVTQKSATRTDLSRASGTSKAVAQANYREDAVYWLSRIISAEAKGEPLKGKIAVGNVVLNRTRSAAYPNTIYGVIFDRKYGVQFSPVSDGRIRETPTAESVIAAKICLEGYSLSNQVLYFLNPRTAQSNWITQNRPFVFRIANHDFYR